MDIQAEYQKMYNEELPANWREIVRKFLRSFVLHYESSRDEGFSRKNAVFYAIDGCIGLQAIVDDQEKWSKINEENLAREHEQRMC